MTNLRSARSIAWLLSASLALAGCSQGVTGGPTADAGASASATSTAAPSPETEPPGSIAAETPMTPPPDASLAVDGGDPIVGMLGSFTWIDHGSDSPWLPGNPIRVGTGETLTLTLAEPVGLADWTASRSPSADPGAAIVGMADGIGGPITFAAPPAGAWSVSVDVQFADNLGSAAYYWLVEVE